MRENLDKEYVGTDALGFMRPAEQGYAVSFSGGERDHLFLNLGGGKFADVAGAAGVDDPADGRVFAHLDFDRDGRTDMAVVNANSPFMRLYRNRVPAPGNFVAVRFEGGNRGPEAASGMACRDGWGAKVLVEAGGRTLVREHRCGEGLGARNTATLRVGIGDAAAADRITVRWPGGTEHVLEDVSAGALVTCWEVPAQNPAGGAFTVGTYGPAVGTIAAADGGADEVRLNAPSLEPDPDADLCMIVTMATWCSACKGELPRSRMLRETFGSEVDMVGLPVDMQEDADELNAYAEQFEPGYRLATGRSADDVAKVNALLEDRIGTSGTPCTVVVDMEGRVLLTRSGLPTVSELRRALAQVR